MYKTILVPIDLGETEAAQNALKSAVEFAKISNGKIRLVSVQQIFPVTYMDYVPQDYDDQLREWATKEITSIANSLKLPQDRVTTTVRFGGTYPEILAEAEDWNADLIVIGSHRPAMSTYLLGSTAKSVVRHAKCSVLVVRD